MIKLLIEVLAAAIGTAAFSVLFQVRPKHYVFCALAGGIAWFAYRVITALSGSVFLATFLRSYSQPVLSVVCHAAARPDAGVPAVRHLPLVPGSAIYYAAFYIFLNKGAEAAYYAAMTVKLGAAIALGILIAYSLPDCLFGWRHKNAKM